jgi:hypothetical protein
MKEPEKIPLDPSTPRTKSINKFPLPKLYPEAMTDDIYIRPDNDSVYIPINKNNENFNESTET